MVNAGGDAPTPGKVIMFAVPFVRFTCPPATETLPLVDTVGTARRPVSSRLRMLAV